MKEQLLEMGINEDSLQRIPLVLLFSEKMPKKEKSKYQYIGFGSEIHQTNGLTTKHTGKKISKIG